MDEGSASVPEAPSIGWLSLPEVAEALGIDLRDVRTALSDGMMLAVRRGGNGACVVPADFLVVDPDSGRQVILPSLRGTIVQLRDSRFTDEEVIRWLFSTDELLGEAPIEALRAGRTHSVRRAAQSLAF
jgi:hypothetical protein